jgi:hypothetical protein
MSLYLTYRHPDPDATTTRFRQLACDPLPKWATDVKDDPLCLFIQNPYGAGLEQEPIAAGQWLVGQDGELFEFLGVESETQIKGRVVSDEPALFSPSHVNGVIQYESQPRTGPEWMIG